MRDVKPVLGFLFSLFCQQLLAADFLELGTKLRPTGSREASSQEFWLCDLTFPDNKTIEAAFRKDLWVPEENKKNCSLLQEAVAETSSIWRVLEFLLPSYLTYISPESLKIEVHESSERPDSYGAMQILSESGNRSTFNLNGSGFQSSNLLRGRIAHEMFHHLMIGSKWPSWFEEMIGILIENEVNPNKQEVRAEFARVQDHWPFLFAQAESYKTKEIYTGLSLFGTYIKERYGGWKFFKEMLELGSPGLDLRPSVAGSESQKIIDVFSRLRSFRDQSHQDPRTGLLDLQRLWKHFIIALHLNYADTSSYDLYQVPGWKGFKSRGISITAAPKSLQTLGFVRIDSSTVPAEMHAKINSELNVYFIPGKPLQLSLNQYLDGLTKWSPKSPQGTLILYNPSLEEQILFKGWD